MCKNTECPYYCEGIECPAAQGCAGYETVILALPGEAEEGKL